jgi:hypothetical protein
VGLLAFVLGDYFANGEGPILWAALALSLVLAGWICYDVSRRIRSSMTDRELNELIVAERRKAMVARKKATSPQPPSVEGKGSPDSSSSPNVVTESSSTEPSGDRANETRATRAAKRIEREVFLRWGWNEANDSIQEIYTALGSPPLGSAVGIHK